MTRTLGRWLLPLLLCVLAGCGDETQLDQKRADDQVRLVESLRSELAAQVAEWESKVEETRRPHETYREAEATSEEEQHHAATEEAYFDAAHAVHDLRLAINELQLKIQRIEGFWEPDVDVVALGDLEQRDEALRRLLVRNAYGDKEDYEPCRVNHVVSCPQTEGPPMVAVFKDEIWDEDAGLGRAVGHVILFMATGSLVPYYEGANVIEPAAVVADVTADGLVEVIDVIPCGYDEGDFWNLYVLPITPAQEDTLQVLWRDEAWGFTAVDPKKEGLHTILIGPRTLDGRVEERARYSWSTAAQRWIGPPGDTTGDFYRLDPGVDEEPQVGAFLEQRALPSRTR